MKDVETEQIILHALVDKQQLGLLEHVQNFHFGTKQGKILFEALKDFHIRERRLPTWGDIALTLRAQSCEPQEYRLFLDFMTTAKRQECPENVDAYIKRLDHLHRCRVLGEKAQKAFDLVEGEDLENAKLELSLALQTAGDPTSNGRMSVQDFSTPSNLDLVLDLEKPLDPGTIIPTGFIEHDKEIGGFFRQQLITLAALRKQGKTAFLLNLAKNFYLLNFNVTVLTMEVSERECKERLLSCISEVPFIKIRLHALDDTDKRKIRMSLLLFVLASDCHELFRAWVSSLGEVFVREKWQNVVTETFTRFRRRYNRLLISNLYRWKASQILTLAQGLAAGHKSDVICVDGLNHIVPDEDKSPLHERLGGAAYAMHNVAGETNHLVVATAQLTEDMQAKYSRAIEEATDGMIAWARTQEDEDRSVTRFKYAMSRQTKSIRFVLKTYLDYMRYDSQEAGIVLRLLRDQQSTKRYLEPGWNLDELISGNDYA